MQRRGLRVAHIKPISKSDEVGTRGPPWPVHDPASKQLDPFSQQIGPPASPLGGYRCIGGLTRGFDGYLPGNTCELYKDNTSPTTEGGYPVSEADKTDDDVESYWNLVRPLARVRGRRLDLTGRTFDRLTVKGPTGRRNRSGSAIWSCLCVCGATKEACSNALMRGKVKSCGCLLRENLRKG